MADLTVTPAGNGLGTVTGPGINCGSDCREQYEAGTPVTLIATPQAGATFAGWSGASQHEREVQGRLRSLFSRPDT
jgi:hypothetical protein